jgi:hypothetical protein
MTTNNFYWDGTHVLYRGDHDHQETYHPEILDQIRSSGPVELYWASEAGTEDLDVDANFEVEFIGEYDSIWDALEAVDWKGRGFLSTPDRGRYTHRILNLHGSLGVETI